MKFDYLGKPNISDEKQIEELKDVSRDDLVDAVINLRHALWSSEEKKNKINNRLYGPSSEKYEQLNLFQLTQEDLLNVAISEGVEAPKWDSPEPEMPKANHKNKKKGLKDSKVMKVVESDLYPENTDSCPSCGAPMKEDKVVDHVIYERIPSYMVKKVIHEHVYVCTNKCSDQDGNLIQIHPNVPESLIPGSVSSPSLVAHIASNRVVLGLPYYRQEKALEREGIHISRQVMSNWLLYCSENHLDVLYKKINEDIRQMKVVQQDETPIIVLKKNGEENKANGYMILTCSGPFEEKQATLCTYSVTRGYIFIPEILGEDYEGYCMSDGYKAYPKFYKDKNLSCFTHARRKLVDAMKSRTDYKVYKNKTRSEKKEYLEEHPQLKLMLELMETISVLYKVEEKLSKGNASPERIYRERQEKSKPVAEKLFQRIHEIEEKTVPNGNFHDALSYFLNYEESLKRYLEDGRFPIDNNICERKAKNFALIRKNIMFCFSERGARSLAVYYTLIETAKMNGLNPEDYLSYCLKRLSQEKITDKLIEELVPYSGKLPKSMYNKQYRRG